LIGGERITGAHPLIATPKHFFEFIVSGDGASFRRLSVRGLTEGANPPGTLASALPNDSTSEGNRLQPGQAYTQAAAGATWGKATSTVGRTVGLGTPRQGQVALRWTF